jgi:hypothetical protein
MIRRHLKPLTMMVVPEGRCERAAARPGGGPGAAPAGLRVRAPIQVARAYRRPASPPRDPRRRPGPGGTPCLGCLPQPPAAAPGRRWSGTPGQSNLNGGASAARAGRLRDPGPRRRHGPPAGSLLAKTQGRASDSAPLLGHWQATETRT